MNDIPPIHEPPSRGPIDRAARVASWPAIELALRARRTVDLSGKNRSAVRRYYVDGEQLPDLLQRDGFSPTCPGPDVLMCEPNATEDRWREIRRLGFREGGRSFGDIEYLQEDPTEFYFGENSLFAWRELDLYKFFARDAVIRSTERMNERGMDPGKGVDINGWVQSALRHASRIRPNPYVTAWMSAHDSLRVAAVPFEGKASFKSKRQLLDCWSQLVTVRAAVEHPDCFNDFHVRVSSDLDEFLSAGFGPPPLRALYEGIGDLDIRHASSQTLMGGRAHACIRYESRDQMEAALPVFRSETRYPCRPGRRPDVALALPSMSIREGRRCYSALYSLWDVGFEPTDVQVLDSRTVYLSFLVPTGGYSFLNNLCADFTHLEEKVVSRKLVQGDSRSDPHPLVRAVSLVYPISGDPVVFAADTQHDDYGTESSVPEGPLELFIRRLKSFPKDELPNEVGSTAETIASALLRILNNEFSAAFNSETYSFDDGPPDSSEMRNLIARYVR